MLILGDVMMKFASVTWLSSSACVFSGSVSSVGSIFAIKDLTFLTGDSFGELELGNDELFTRLFVKLLLSTLMSGYTVSKREVVKFLSVGL